MAKNQGSRFDGLLTRCYELALLALPRGFRGRWAADMRSTFDERLGDARPRGIVAAAATTSRELASVARAAILSRVEQATGRVHRAHDAQDGSDVWRTDSTPALYPQHDRRSLKVAWLGALACHFVLFMVVFPGAGDSMPIDPPAKEVLRITPLPPPPPKVDVPVEKIRQDAPPFPIPDPTPDEIEPIVADSSEYVATMGSAVDAEFSMAAPVGPPPPLAERFRAGSGVEAPRLIERIEPDYPALAARARHECTVILEAVIGKDGAVVDVEVLRGCSFGLNESALAAVSQWRYTPTLLNGRPVEVIVTVTVHYLLR
jgi:protein TonB